MVIRLTALVGRKGTTMNVNDNKSTTNANTSNAKTSQNGIEAEHRPAASLIRGFRLNAEGEAEVLLALRVDEETIDANHQRSEIIYIKIGARRYPCILRWVPAGECIEYIRMEWADVKVEARSKRCLLEDGKGGFIRCPERKGKSCRTCDRACRTDIITNRPVSLDALLEDKNYEPKASFLPDLTVLETMELLDMLIAKLNEKSPKYGKIFMALFYGIKKPIDIARELGLPVSTTYEDVPKVRRLAQEIYQKLTTI